KNVWLIAAVIKCSWVLLILSVCFFCLEPVPLLEESPKRKSVSYEELRNRNRETYEVALTQKAETPVKSSQERAFKKEGNLITWHQS
uniref:Uncharacterized protein n=1 Tax=Terrapene triunguis TaxID=2587831 RepID=A0A674J0X2_9SAUR